MMCALILDIRRYVIYFLAEDGRWIGFLEKTKGGPRGMLAKTQNGQPMEAQ